jgi:hypothetical protein
MSEAGIRGIFANIKDESGFNPSLRVADQPRWGGEAHYAHGLYQEGGQEWNNYDAWLRRNYPNTPWNDPVLQTRFLAQNLKDNYPSVWTTINNVTPELAAQAFLHGYLKPRADMAANRARAYERGVPEIDQYADNAQPNAVSQKNDLYPASPSARQQNALAYDRPAPVGNTLYDALWGNHLLSPVFDNGDNRRRALLDFNFPRAPGSNVTPLPQVDVS